MSSVLQEAARNWAQGTALEPLLPLSAQPQYAAIFVILGLALSAMFILAEKRSAYGTFRAFVLSILASLAFGFGGVFLIDAVGVYT